MQPFSMQIRILKCILNSDLDPDMNSECGSGFRRTTKKERKGNDAI
jgi:hypothetical protein